MQKNDPTNSARTAFGLMLLPFRPLMAIMMLLNRNPQEVQMVTTVRVQQISGQLREARIEHDLMAGSIGRGDDVSLWGTTSGAVLFVAEGYNHTTSADIRLVGVAPSFLRNLVRFLGMVMAAFVVYLVCVLILSVINRS